MSNDQEKLETKIDKPEAAAAHAQQAYDEAESGLNKKRCFTLLMAKKKALQQLCLLHAAATAGAGTGDSVEVDYVVDSLSFDEFTFEHNVPCVNMHAVHMKHVLSSMRLLRQTQRGQPYHNLSDLCAEFAKNYRSGTSEAAFHGRDDALLQILELLCPVLDHTTYRNSITEGSHAYLRHNATYGQPPVVFF